MRRLIAGVAAAAVAATLATPALSKAHMQPSDRADQLGQCNASAVMRDANCNVIFVNGAPVADPTGARNVDARGLLGDPKGVDGQSFSADRSASGGSERGQKGPMLKGGSSN